MHSRWLPLRQLLLPEGKEAHGQAFDSSSTLPGSCVISLLSVHFFILAPRFHRARDKGSFEQGLRAHPPSEKKGASTQTWHCSSLQKREKPCNGGGGFAFLDHILLSCHFSNVCTASVCMNNQHGHQLDLIIFRTDDRKEVDESR